MNDLEDRFNAVVGADVAFNLASMREVPPEPLPEERAAIAWAAPRRRREFAWGRACARAALAKLGVPSTAVPTSADRTPIWPSGFIGSISHAGTDALGFCAAAVCAEGRLRAIGIDAELREPLEPALFETVLTTEERRALLGWPADERGEIAKLMFSAKEAVYKCQYRLTRVFLDFHDLAISLRPADGRFAVSDAQAGRTRPVLGRLQGFWFRTDELLLTVATAPAGG